LNGCIGFVEFIASAEFVELRVSRVYGGNSINAKNAIHAMNSINANKPENPVRKA